MTGLRDKLVDLPSEREKLIALQTKSRRAAVTLMCASLAESRTEAARRTKASGIRFLSGLRRAIVTQRKRIRLDHISVQQAALHKRGKKHSRY